MDAVVEWVDARERLPRPGYPVAAADRVIRLPYGRPGAQSVTHWAALPALPGMTVHRVLGEDARTALRDALSSA